MAYRGRPPKTVHIGDMTTSVMESSITFLHQEVEVILPSTGLPMTQDFYVQSGVSPETLDMFLLALSGVGGAGIETMFKQIRTSLGPHSDPLEAAAKIAMPIGWHMMKTSWEIIEDGFLGE
jgi:hypothetical protein